jgi:hypothetical protein
MTSTQKILSYVGIIAALYVLFAYIVPFILKLIGIAFGFLLKIVLFAAIVFVIIIALSFIIRAYRK